MEKYIVERIDEGTVILEKEDLTHIEIKKSAFSFDISEGDILLFDGGAYLKDDKERNERKEKLLSLQEKLAKRSKKQ